MKLEIGPSKEAKSGGFFRSFFGFVEAPVTIAVAGASRIKQVVKESRKGRIYISGAAFFPTAKAAAKAAFTSKPNPKGEIVKSKAAKAAAKKTKAPKGKKAAKAVPQAKVAKQSYLIL